MVRAKPKMQKILYLAIQVIVIWMMALLTIGSYTVALQNINDRWVATGYPIVLIAGIGVVTGASIVLLAASNIVNLLRGKSDVLTLMAPKEGAEEFAME